ncbi:unnamed protein product [Ceutorhynchus assimilis]|uniref:CRAL-TRIO domain-containing protein n=1 Tax=Ceutorhynchus assimilis TaxID=467358 RepID=A0A9N9MUM5_9CUCU|nr:unnamed protein product [Ceutorhynchus assimilis]
MNMSKLSKLLQVTPEEEKAILEHFKITEAEFEENVRILKEWIGQCEHLPKEDDENKFRIVLLNSKMSLEKAKQSMEGYYRVRTRYSNEFFDKLTPKDPEYIDAKKLVRTVVLPKLTPDLNRVTIFKMNDPNGEATDAYSYQIPVLMMAEIRIAHDLCLSNILIIDFKDYGWKNLVKYTPTVNQKLIDILNSINLRIHSIHFINLTNFVDHLMRLLKNLLPAKLLSKIHIHKSHDTLTEFIPKEFLPSDYKGTAKSLDEFYEEWCEEIEKQEEIFIKLLSIKSTEKIELDPMQSEMFGCGVEGSFKKLALD